MLVFDHLVLPDRKVYYWAYNFNKNPVGPIMGQPGGKSMVKKKTRTKYFFVSFMVTKKRKNGTVIKDILNNVVHSKDGVFWIGTIADLLKKTTATNKVTILSFQEVTKAQYDEYGS